MPIRDNFYDSDKNNFSPRLSAGVSDQRRRRRSARASGCSTAPASSRIASSRSRTTSSAAACRPADVPNNGLAYPVDPRSSATCCRSAATRTNTRTSTTCSTAPACRANCRATINLTVGYTGSQGKDMFLRGVGNTLDPVTRAAAGAQRYGQIDYKTSGCVDGLVINGNADHRLRHGASYNALQIERDAPVPLGLHRRPAVSVLAQPRHDPGLERSGDDAEHVRLRDRVRHQPAGHPAHVQRLAGLPAAVRGSAGRAAGASAASSTPAAACRSTSPSAGPTTRTVNGATVTNIPGGNSRGTQRPDLVPGVDPYLKRRRALAQPGGVRRRRSPARSATCRATSCAARVSGRPT